MTLDFARAGVSRCMAVAPARCVMRLGAGRRRRRARRAAAGQRRRAEPIRWIGPTGAARSRTPPRWKRASSRSGIPRAAPAATSSEAVRPRARAPRPSSCAASSTCWCRDKPGTETEGEKVVCVDAATGEQLWQHRFNVYLTDVPDTRVGWSSVVGDPDDRPRLRPGRVRLLLLPRRRHAARSCGTTACTKSSASITTYGGRTNVPVVFEDLVLISAVVVGWGDTPEFDELARPSHRFMAFDKATGELRWLAGTTISPPDTTYSTPTATVDRRRGAAHLRRRRRPGVELAAAHRQAAVELPVLAARHQRLAAGRRRHGVHGPRRGEHGRHDQGRASWRSTPSCAATWPARKSGSPTTSPAGKSSPVMVDGKLWVVDDGAKLHILDPETGEQIGHKKALGTRMAEHAAVRRRQGLRLHRTRACGTS